MLYVYDYDEKENKYGVADTVKEEVEYMTPEALESYRSDEDIIGRDENGIRVVRREVILQQLDKLKSDGVITDDCTVLGEGYLSAAGISGKEFRIPYGVSRIDYLSGNVDKLYISGSVEAINFEAMQDIMIGELEFSKKCKQICIGEDAFSGCSLRTSTLDLSCVGVMGEYAFNECQGIEHLIFGDDLEFINHYNFSRISSLKTVKLGKNVKALREFAFSDCQELSSINLEDTEMICLWEGCLMGTNLESVILPETCHAVWDISFGHCTKLKSVIFNGHLDTLHKDAFYNCGAIEYVEFRYKEDYDGFHGVFADCPLLENIYIRETDEYLPK